MVFLRMHGQGMLANEIFWGLWLFPFGLMAYRSRFLPRILGVWLMLNCFAYLATSVTGILWPQYEQSVSNWVFPVMFGELAIMLLAHHHRGQGAAAPCDCRRSCGDLACPHNAFLLLYGTTVAGMFFVWFVILLTHLRFRQTIGRERATQLPVKLPMHPWMTLAGLLAVSRTLRTFSPAVATKPYLRILNKKSGRAPSNCDKDTGNRERRGA
jgi:Domain of unknown function (DUF4386)